MLTIERSLNIYAAGIPQIISLSQYDDDFQLVFTLYTSEGEFTIPSGTTAEVMGTKVDGNGYSASASISGSTVTVTGNKQMTACAGRNVYEIVLTKSGKRLATVNFILKVERAALDADTIQSETVLKELNAIIDSAETSTQAAAEAAASAAAAAESARTLTIDPTLTQSGQAADAKVTGDRISAISEGGTEIITVDKSTFSKLDAYINQSATNLTSDAKCKTAYFACEPNITYTVHKVASARFMVGYTKTTPAHAVSVYGVQANNNATELTVETGADAAYLVAYYYDSGNDTLSESVIYNSLQVTYEISSDVTAVDRVAREAIEHAGGGLSDAIKSALLACFRGVTWEDDDSQLLYSNLESALYSGETHTLVASFSANYRTVFTDDPIDSIKDNLTVLYDGEAVARADYTLSGNLAVGQNKLTVSYKGRSASVTVPAVEIPWTVSVANDNMTLFNGAANKYASDGSGYGGATLSASSNRRTFYIGYGRYPFHEDNNGLRTNAFPVSVPVGATKATITLTPSSYYAMCFCSKYQLKDTPPLATLSPDTGGLKASPITFNLPNSDGQTLRTLSISIARNSSGSAYTDSTNPTGCTITFE